MNKLYVFISNGSIILRKGVLIFNAEWSISPFGLRTSILVLNDKWAFLAFFTANLIPWLCCVFKLNPTPEIRKLNFLFGLTIKSSKICCSICSCISLCLGENVPLNSSRLFIGNPTHRLQPASEIPKVVFSNPIQVHSRDVSPHFPQESQIGKGIRIINQ